ncbi:hypothetical protein WICPIJ_007798 [Wickerhamomyces pijperi]|uniref:Uncharacterized protein n=1 Tax=Wickerhamomyces pijperi TaxID=599730 RepID=A0A9P8Q145_WICPI|nr:hypothetical protein WICPIJ_007798 [Wickerhamomyces pijperi]
MKKKEKQPPTDNEDSVPLSVEEAPEKRTLEECLELKEGINVTVVWLEALISPELDTGSPDGGSSDEELEEVPADDLEFSWKSVDETGELLIIKTLDSEVEIPDVEEATGGLETTKELDLTSDDFEDPEELETNEELKGTAEEIEGTNELDEGLNELDKANELLEETTEDLDEEIETVTDVLDITVAGSEDKETTVDTIDGLDSEGPEGTAEDLVKSEEEITDEDASSSDLEREELDDEAALKSDDEAMDLEEPKSE